MGIWLARPFQTLFCHPLHVLTHHTPETSGVRVACAYEELLAACLVYWKAEERRLDGVLVDAVLAAEAGADRATSGLVARQWRQGHGGKVAAQRPPDRDTG